MYQILATKMAVGTSGDFVTQPVSMDGANAVVVDITAFTGAISAVKLQGSNDLENWTVIGSNLNSATLTGPIASYLPGSATVFSSPASAGMQYVRLLLTASQAAIVGCGINTSPQ